MPAPDSSAFWRSSTAAKKSISLSARWVESAWLNSPAPSRAVVAGDHATEDADVGGVFNQTVRLFPFLADGAFQHAGHQFRELFRRKGLGLPLLLLRLGFRFGLVVFSRLFLLHFLRLGELVRVDPSYCVAELVFVGLIQAVQHTREALELQRG